MRWVLRGKIHRATVTQTRLDYEGSITVDIDLLEKAGIWVSEKVFIANVTNGNRFETYAMEGDRGSGIIALNGAAAHLCDVGDKIIIMGFELTDVPIKAKAVAVDEDNRAVKEFTY
ncbi:MAG: aspartate 1-decarboxylase [Methanomassiliicoccaceae archaeon]|nr:aspartate 1-decarboxylase [Methanomassiliicoccaceae archaeon]